MAIPGYQEFMLPLLQIAADGQEHKILMPLPRWRITVAMGYGGSRMDAAQVVGKSGDGGIDGVIKEDRLGLDMVYVHVRYQEA